MTTHELVFILTAMPEVPLIGDSVGQGSEEGQNAELQAVRLSKDKQNAYLIFYPLELNRQTMHDDYGDPL